MKNLFPVVLAGLLLASLALLFAERGKVTALREETRRLREELTAAQRLGSTQGNGPDGQQNQELERLRTEALEVHKLRNEVSQLRTGAKELARLKTENQQLRATPRQFQSTPRTDATASPAATSKEGFYAKEDWTFTGYATPETALQSVVWAMREGDTRTFLASLTPEEIARVQKEWGNKSEAEISADSKRGIDKISNIRILESQTLSDDEVVLNVYAAGGEDKVQKVSMKLINGEWKLAGPKKEQ